MRSQRPDNPFDAMRRVIEREANQDDDNGFFAKLGDIEPDHAPTGHSLGLFQHWDTERGGPAFKWPPRDNGGKLPTGLNTVTNRTGRPILISPFTVYRSLYPKTPRTRVYQTRHKYWRFACNKCPQGAESPDWKLIQKLADHHARNHHRSQ